MKPMKLSSDKLFFAAACVLCLVSGMMLVFALQRPATDAFAGLRPSQVIRHGSAKIGISGIERQSGSGRYQAPKGKHYVVLTLTVTNMIDTPITIAPVSDSYLKNTRGDVVYLTPLELANPFRSGQLLPHETIRGELSYLVNDADSYAYYLESDWTGGVVSYSLQ